MLGDDAENSFAYFAIVLPVFEMFLALGLIAVRLTVVGGAGGDQFGSAIAAVPGVVRQAQIAAQDVDALLATETV
ncbi:hypothetical protein [Nocardia vinacea]|uniref:hypothetical protein n=1 Tax=Nocardia vinacea TaxID=96468 RepID=UPI000311474E|nr:hypothetical protein [Nocardia vinacea]